MATEVLVGGDFANAGGVSGADHIARWNGTTWSAVGEPEALNGPVNTIALSGTEVLVGGDFANAGGVSGADHIARWNGTTWSAVGEPEALNGSVNTIVVDGAKVYVGGLFTNAGNNPVADHIAVWDGTAWSGLLSGGTTGLNGGVRALALQGSDLLAGGDFFNAGGNPLADFIARYGFTRVYLPLVTR